MPYLRKGNPYDPGYAIPKYVIEEKERRAIRGARLPRGSISAPQPPVHPTPMAPRRFVMTLPPNDFRKQTGKIYPSSVLGSLGSAGLGSLGAVDLKTASQMATVLATEKASWNGTPERALNDANDVVRASAFVRTARANGRQDDWIATVLRNYGYATNVINMAFNVGVTKDPGFRGTNTTFQNGGGGGGQQLPQDENGDAHVPEAGGGGTLLVVGALAALIFALKGS